MSVLRELVAAARLRARELPKLEPERRPTGPGFADALRGRGRVSVIAEVKRKSPSRGDLAPAADALAQARRYAQGGASAISVLTEPTRFGGSLDDLERVAAGVARPALMKDFVVDPAQVRTAARLGARALLLIVRALSQLELDELQACARGYGLDALVECHDEGELERALAAGATLVGVNNRNLDTLAVDLALAPRLLARVPAEVVAVAESGYERGADLAPLAGLCDAVLVGSALMTAPDPLARLRELVAATAPAPGGAP